ncbi:MAG: hypothetical protein KatS3mg109_1702 [Pirellulaceae bacterium]|nr:MAG: hypothetical protein KatS3mg109_1702 [Pirellulaceae bacterium]GIW94031.1 MAG: hypothetical protein KatS3mg110_2072 [Pirellulaceae bacterium]
MVVLSCAALPKQHVTDVIEFAKDSVMTSKKYFWFTGWLAAVWLVTATAWAGQPKIAERWALRHASVAPWHGSYYHTAYGRPVPLVVPPTATTYSSLSWGVARTETRPIYHQFRRPYPGDVVSAEGVFLPTPAWPSHTDQFGVYYVRGPW